MPYSIVITSLGKEGDGRSAGSPLGCPCGFMFYFSSPLCHRRAVSFEFWYTPPPGDLFFCFFFNIFFCLIN